jgi:tetratricopeptide (TPR) repeat protein
MAYYNRGLMFAALGRHTEALVDFDAAIRLDPHDAMAYSDRGNAHGALGRHAEALADYDAAIRIDPNFAHAYVNKGVLHTERGEWDDALRAFETAARLGDATGAQYAAQVRQDIGRPSERDTASAAQQAFDAFLEADDSNELRRAVERHPILARPDFHTAIEHVVAGQVPAPRRPGLRQRIDRLRQLTAPNTKP